MEAQQNQLIPLFGGTAQTCWRGHHAALFPSDESLRWFLRLYRAELVQRGGLVLLAGRWVATPELSALVREIGQRQALLAVGEVA